MKESTQCREYTDLELYLLIKKTTNRTSLEWSLKKGGLYLQVKIIAFCLFFVSALSSLVALLILFSHFHGPIWNSFMHFR